jgi:hypothetical protein
MAELLGEGSGVLENEKGELTACMVRIPLLSFLEERFWVRGRLMRSFASCLQVGVYFPPSMPSFTSATETRLLNAWIDTLLFKRNLRVGAGYHQGRWIARCSAQVFNDVRLARAPFSHVGCLLLC